MDIDTLHGIIDTLPPEVTIVNLVNEDFLTTYKISEVYVNSNTLSLVFNTRDSNGKAQ